MRIFFSPLDWGLGHASRCVPVIRYLLEKNIEVIIGAEGTSALFLKEHFPHIEFINFPGYRVSYSRHIPAGIKVLLQIPKINSFIKREHTLLAEIIEKKKIDAILSDNRYGLWNDKIPSVIITHQLNIQAPAANSLLSTIVCKHIKHFNKCWIPDYKGANNLSGVLSHPIPKGINGIYTGPLSRFYYTPEPEKEKKYDLLVILSGPEPQRSELEILLLKQLKELPYLKTLIIQGLPGSKSRESRLANVEIVPHLSDEEFEQAVKCSKVILSRPGYSTVMDLHIIANTKSIFIPTPGQTEQEYLGNLSQKKEWAICFKQKGFSLKKAMEKTSHLTVNRPVESSDTFKKVIDDWVVKIS